MTGREEVELVRPAYGASPAVDAELRIDVLGVRAHGAQGHPQAPRDVRAVELRGEHRFRNEWILQPADAVDLDGDPLSRCRMRSPGRHADEVTFLGAHVVPQEYADRRDDYVALVAGEMLDACAPHATWIDVFCDRGAFDGDEARHILKSGVAKGLRPRVHANQLQQGPGVQVAIEVGAASADHCTHLSDDDVEALAASDVVATLLPGAEFSTRAQYPDARRLLDRGVTVALAADCNPGSSYTTNMPFCIAVAVRDMRMTPSEAVWSATAGGAAALRRTDVGHLGAGARGDLVLLDAPSHLHLAYRPGVPLVRSVFRAGARVR